MLAHKHLYLFILSLLAFSMSYAQPDNDNCATAKTIDIFDGEGCASANNTGADDDLKNFPASPSCLSPNQGNEIWFVFQSLEEASKIKIYSQDVTDQNVNVFSGNCNNLALENCFRSSNGRTELIISHPNNEPIYISISSPLGDEGLIDVCIEPYEPDASPANICEEAIEVCTKEPVRINNLAGISSSNTQPSCFKLLNGTPTNVRRDTWYKFTVSKSGRLEFAVFPHNTDEFDWALYDITNGCLGSELSCNYNFSRSQSGGNSGVPTGMWEDPTIFENEFEFNNAISVAKGRTYAIVIDNFDNGLGGFDLIWGGTFEMGVKADFTADKIFSCDDFNANLTDQSVGNNLSYEWFFNDSLIHNNAFPPPVEVNEAGNHVLSLKISNGIGCSDLHSIDVINNKIEFLPESRNIDLCAGEVYTFNNDVVFTEFISPITKNELINEVIEENTANSYILPIQNKFPLNFKEGDLKSVCISAFHSDLSTLSGRLINPSGNTIQLFNEGQLDGTRATDLCFSMEATNSVTFSNQPYTGEFLPVDDFNSFIGDFKNGIWQLEITDNLADNNLGTLISLGISFYNNNELNVKWSPLTYLNTDSLVNPTISIPPELDKAFNSNYQIDLSDNTSCTDQKDISVFAEPTVNAGPDTTVYFCKNTDPIFLDDLLPLNVYRGGPWLNENDQNMGANFRPEDFYGETIIRKYVSSSPKCGSDTSIYTLVVRPDFKPLISYDQSYCDNLGSEISLDYNQTGNYILEYHVNGNKTSLPHSSNPLVLNFQTPDFPISIDSVGIVSPFVCYLDINESINPTAIPSPKLVLDSTVCNSISTEYIAYFTLQGGDPNSTRVNGQLVTGSKFQSAAIPNGQSRTFIAEDDNQCSKDTVIVTEKCNCKSDAGELNNYNDIVICDNDTAFIAYSVFPTEDPNDVSEFIISTDPAPNFNIIKDRYGYSEVFELFFSALYNQNETYYITAVTGSQADNNSVVDLEDPCLDFTPSVKFSFKESPIGFAQFTDTSACVGDAVEIIYNISNGKPNFGFFSNGNQIHSSSTFSGSFNYTITQSENFTLDSVQSQEGCAGLIEEILDQQLVGIEFPRAEDLNFTCNATASKYVLSFNIVGGDTSSYKIFGSVPGVLNGKSFTSDSLLNGEAYQLFIADDFACDTFSLSGDYICDCKSVAPNIDNFPRIVCETDTLNISYEDLNNNGLDDDYFLDPNDTIVNIVIRDLSELNDLPNLNPEAILEERLVYLYPTLNNETTYYLVSLVGNASPNNFIDLNDPCLSYGEAAEFYINSQPKVSTAIIDTLCFGESYATTYEVISERNINFDLKSTNGSNLNLTALSGTNTFNFNDIEVGINKFFITEIIDNSDAECTGIWLGDTISLYQINTPTIDLLNTPDTLCSGEELILNFDLETEGNVSFEIFQNANFLGNYNSTSGVISVTSLPVTKAEKFEISTSIVYLGLRSCEFNEDIELPVEVWTHDFNANSNQDFICEDESGTLDLSFSYNENNVFYKLNGTETSAFFTNDSGILNFSAEKPNLTFDFDSVQTGIQSTATDAFCTFVLDTQIVIETKPIPEINFLGLSQNPLCVNQSYPLDFEFTGSPNFNFDLTYTNTQNLVSTSLTSTESFFTEAGQTQLLINNLSDAFCNSDTSIIVDFLLSQKPNLNLSETPIDSCAPGEIAIALNSNSINTCEWTINGQSISNNCSDFNLDLDNPSQDILVISYLNQDNCPFQDSVELLMHPTPVADFNWSPEVPTTSSPLIFTNNLSSNALYYQWYLNDEFKSNSEETEIELTSLTGIEEEVSLVATNQFGCRDEISYTIMVAGQLTFYIPNTFTPDGDGINDCFSVIASSNGLIDQYELFVFDRWGQEVFYSQDITECWNGEGTSLEALRSGVFTVLVNYTNIQNNKTESVRAIVKLLR